MRFVTDVSSAAWWPAVLVAGLAAGAAHPQAFDPAGIVGPVTEQALCVAGNERLGQVMQPGVAIPGVPPDARSAARLKFDKAFEQLGDGQYDACLPFLDEAFELLGLPASYAKAAAAGR